MKEVSTEELKRKVDAGQVPYLIDVLSPESYTARHVPGARNVRKSPPETFVERFEKEIGAPKDAEIIVYCSSHTCTASPLCGGLLEKAGYTNVAHYTDGIAGWQQAGHEFEPKA